VTQSQGRDPRESMEHSRTKSHFVNQAPVAHLRHPSYLGGSDLKDHSLRPPWANSSRGPISKITRAKWAGVVAQAVEHLLCKCEALS
jgi:hypothetical protein